MAPIYDFICENEECNAHEQVITMLCGSNYNEKVCEICGKPLKKIVSLFGFTVSGGEMRY